MNVTSLISGVNLSKLDVDYSNRPSFVVSFRCFLVISFLLYLLLGPVAKESDVVASVLSYTFFCFLLLFALAVVIKGYMLRKKFSFSLTSPGVGILQDASGEAIQMRAGSKTILAMRVGACNIWPLFVLHVKIEFENPGLPELTHQITGSSRSERVLPQELTFPHRGNWSTKSVVVRFSDQFDFFSFRWKVPEEEIRRVFEIHPPQAYESTLPILSSSHRAGEIATDVSERKGDPFDIKQYHPSDGMKKIVWKIFAKRGELMTRHQEQSITPEGQVLVFTMADPGEDHVCAATIAYLRMLEDLELEIFFGCEGMRDSELAHTWSQAEEKLIDCVWNASASTPDSIAAEVSTLVENFQARARDAHIERVIVFCSVERLQGKRGSDLMTALGDCLHSKGITPVFCFSKLDTTAIPSAAAAAGPKKTGLLRRAEAWIFDRSASLAPATPQFYTGFMATCMRNQWQVLI